MDADPPQTCEPRISLAYCVGRDEAETSFLAEKAERAPKEMRHKI
jgi:hypothetical protein